MKTLINSILTIRQVIFTAWLYLFVIIFASISVILNLLKAPLFIRVWTIYFWSLSLRIGIFCFLWIRVRVEGKENIPKKPCVYVCKHQSHLETLFLPSLLPRCVFVLKQELLSIPIFGRGIKATECIAIDRSKGLKALKDVVTEGKDRLAKRISVIIFPEGTRTKPKQHPAFHKSGLMLAKQSEHQVVFIALNTGSLMSMDRKLIRPGKVTLVISKPVDTVNYNLNELTEYSHQWIKEQMERIEK